MKNFIPAEHCLNYQSHHLLSLSCIFVVPFLVFLLAAPLSLRTGARRENECTLEPTMEDHHPTVSFRALTKEPGEARFRGSVGAVEKWLRLLWASSAELFFRLLPFGRASAGAGARTARRALPNGPLVPTKYTYQVAHRPLHTF